MNTLIKSIEEEYRRYKSLAESALGQVEEGTLSQPGHPGGNSLAVIGWHLSGNLQSRFTDFLTSDGEKPWRDREEEFAARSVSRAELNEKWERGWQVLLDTLVALTDDDLTKSVVIRGRPLFVHEALNRSLAHVSYHVGQIVYVAHMLRGNDWKYLTIAPGASAAYNANPAFEKPSEHKQQLDSSKA
ncbi:MAG: DUF1572 family protein [Gemmatimonadaceae bacterium]